MPCMTVANNTNTRDCIVGNGHILQWDLMSKINSVYGTSAGNTMRCIHDESLSTQRYTVMSTFASVNFVNVGLNHWFCSPILLLILVIELRKRTIHLAIETRDKADRPRKSEVPFHLLTIPIRFASTGIVPFLVNGMQPYPDTKRQSI